MSFDDFFATLLHDNVFLNDPFQIVVVYAFALLYLHNESFIHRLLFITGYSLISLFITDIFHLLNFTGVLCWGMCLPSAHFCFVMHHIYQEICMFFIVSQRYIFITTFCCINAYCL